MTDKTLNIILASHCDFENLKFTIKKILSYNLSNLKLIVVDSGRDKKSYLYLKSISSNITFISEPDNGIADAWNKGINLIENGWVMFLGCGDFISKIDIKKIFYKINNIDENNVIYGDTIIVSENNYKIKKSKSFNFDQYKSFPFMHPSVVVPFESFKFIGMFDHTYKLAMDSDWLIRVFLSKKYNFIQCEHSVEMLDNGLSVQNWLSANIEFLRSKLINFKFNKIIFYFLIIKLLFINFFVLKFRINKFFHFIKRTLHNFYIKFINILLRYIPFYYFRYLTLKFLLRIKIDSSCSVHNSVSFKTLGNLKIGNNTVINKNVYFDNSYSIEIGNNVSISQHSKFLSLGHDIHDSHFKTKGKSISIGDYCVLFTGCYVLPGTKLPRASVVYPNVNVSGRYKKSVVLASSTVVLKERSQEDLKYNLIYKDWFC